MLEIPRAFTKSGVINRNAPSGECERGAVINRLRAIRLLSPKKTTRKADGPRYSGLRILLLTAPSQPHGQWHSAVFVPAYSDGFAPVFHRTSRISHCFAMCRSKYWVSFWVSIHVELMCVLVMYLSPPSPTLFYRGAGGLGWGETVP